MIAPKRSFTAPFRRCLIGPQWSRFASRWQQHGIPFRQVFLKLRSL